MRRLAMLMVLSAIPVTIAAGSGEREAVMIIDFSQGNVTWPHINDGVMGGRSDGRFKVNDDKKMEFFGEKQDYLILKTVINEMTLKVPVDKIGKVIGPGGKYIKSIEAETHATVEIDEDGTIHVASTDMEAAETAIAMIEAVTAEVKVGKSAKKKRRPAIEDCVLDIAYGFRLREHRDPVSVGVILEAPPT